MLRRARCSRSAPLCLRVATAHAALPHHLMTFESHDLVALGLKTPMGEFDLKFVPGRVIAMPIPEFLAWAEKKELKVLGRVALRSGRPICASDRDSPNASGVIQDGAGRYDQGKGVHFWRRNSFNSADGIRAVTGKRPGC